MNAVTKDLNGYGTIPGNWDVAALPDAVFFQEGPGLRKWQWTESGMKVINVTNILADGRIDTNNTSRFISIEEYEKTYRHFTVNAGDIIVASSGNTYGKVGRISAKDLPLMMNTSVIRFRSSDRRKLDDGFLYAFLRSEVFSNQVESFVIGSAQPNFGPTHLKRMVMPLPPLPVQQRIAGILSAYDELIENSQRRIRILEAMARALYREWFVRFRFPGHENRPLVASPLGEIPQGWERTTFAQAAVFENGDRGKNYPNGNDFVEEGIPFINAGHLVDGAVDLANMNYILEEKFGQLRSGKIRKGDLLFCLRGSPGRTARTAGLCRGAIASSLVIIRPTERANEAFLYHAFAGEIGKRMVIELDNGAAQPNVSVGSVQKYPLLLPPMDLLREFAKLIEPSWRHTEILRDQLSNLRKQRDLLMPRLLSGQIDVSNLTEPAAA